MASLTNPKHEKFCMVWHETGNKSEAYRESHPNSLKWKDATIHNRASALSKVNEVLARFSELQELALKNHDVTVESLLEELEAVRALAMTAETPQCSAASSAIMHKAKLVGLDINKTELAGNINISEVVRRVID